MLSQLERLSRNVDGRYATDTELEFLADYVRSFSLRMQTYQKLQAAEALIVKQVYTQMRSIDPLLFRSSNEDISLKWKQDTIRVLRYTAVALLMDDAETFREKFLFWFQTIMRAFNAERSCDVTYEVMQKVVKQHLTAPEAALFCPILELTRRSLGIVA